MFFDRLFFSKKFVNITLLGDVRFEKILYNIYVLWMSILKTDDPEVSYETDYYGYAELFAW